MKNNLSDLNNHLFAQLERLGDEDLAKEEFEKEIKRSQAITGVANSIIANARLEFDVRKAETELRIDCKGNKPRLIACTPAPLQLKVK